MKRDRITDRVHVVREPEALTENEEMLPSPMLPTIQSGRGMEIIKTLAQISDRLKRSEAERYELLAELREYRKSLNDLEDKAEKSEKAYQTLENKIKTRDVSETEITQRQARFERALKDAETKLVQAAAGQNILDSRLKDMETFNTAVNQRLDETVVQQARIDRQIDKISQDKLRTLRKVERMEEILNETQDTLKARAMVLLTDQDSAAKAGGYPQIAAYNSDEGGKSLPWWRRPSTMQGVGLGSMVVAALLFGWALNQMQQPDMPRLAVMENGELAKLNVQQNRWEPVKSDAAAAVTPTPTPVPVETAETQSGAEALPAAADGSEITDPDSAGTPSAPQTPSAQAALNASDEELLSALEENSDSLAAQLNEIAPEARKELEDVPVADTATPAAAQGYDPLKTFGTTAFAQDQNTAAKIAAEQDGSTLSGRINADAALPAPAKKLEEQAFRNDGNAQHDLAAIYTAGRGGVTQDFEKAAAWFREAAGNNVANAAYNLGVLYHQGLGVEKDLSKAMYWYKEAAKNGHAEAQYNLGIANIEGIGTPYDAPLAAAFFESAANKGVVEAAYNLGLIYENGLIGGTPKPEEALMWYKVAADGGNGDAKSALQQLATSMQIDMDRVDQLAERMQTAYASSTGRRAGS